jgi:hypothetical protein
LGFKTWAFRSFIESRARAGEKFLFNEPIMDVVGLKPAIPADRAAIGAILGEISAQTKRESNILLSVLVHRKSAGRTRPGREFRNLAKMLGYDFDDYDDFLKRETQKVLKHDRG